VVLFCVSFCIMIGGYQNLEQILVCTQFVISSGSQPAPPKKLVAMQIFYALLV